MNESERETIDKVDLQQLGRVAELMCQRLTVPCTIGLCGTLGAGKTTLVQAIARAAGVDTADVTSPTFTLVQSYAGTPRLHHLDAYRVADVDEFVDLGVDELFEDSKAMTLVEWADRVAEVMPETALWIEISPSDDSQQRRLSFWSSDESTRESIRRITGEFRDVS